MCSKTIEKPRRHAGTLEVDIIFGGLCPVRRGLFDGGAAAAGHVVVPKAPATVVEPAEGRVRVEGGDEPAGVLRFRTEVLRGDRGRRAAAERAGNGGAQGIVHGRTLCGRRPGQAQGVPAQPVRQAVPHRLAAPAGRRDRAKVADVPGVQAHVTPDVPGAHPGGQDGLAEEGGQLVGQGEKGCGHHGDAHGRVRVGRQEQGAGGRAVLRRVRAEQRVRQEGPVQLYVTDGQAVRRNSRVHPRELRQTAEVASTERQRN